MTKYSVGQFSEVVLPKNLPDGLPAVFDSVSFAHSLGLQHRTVWWLVWGTSLPKLESGHGTYSQFRIPKKTGGVRLIHAPKKTMRRVQQVILHRYLNPLPVGEWVGAYVKGRDMVYSVNKHVNKDVVISMDLSDFFGSTKRRWVRQWLTSIGYNEEVARIFSGLVTVPIKGKTHVQHVVPQGAPTSGALTNHIASMRLDVPLLEMLQARELKDLAYTRYADDLTISYNGFLPKEDFEALLAAIKNQIRQAGYRVNKKKTRVAVSRPATGSSQRMLGMSIHKKPNVPRVKKRELRARVDRLCKALCNAEDWKSRARLEGDATRLRAELQYWARVNPVTIQPLLDRLTAQLIPADPT